MVGSTQFFTGSRKQQTQVRSIQLDLNFLCHTSNMALPCTTRYIPLNTAVLHNALLSPPVNPPRFYYLHFMLFYHIVLAFFVLMMYSFLCFTYSSHVFSQTTPVCLVLCACLMHTQANTIHSFTSSSWPLFPITWWYCTFWPQAHSYTRLIHTAACHAHTTVQSGPIRTLDDCTQHLCLPRTS